MGKWKYIKVWKYGSGSEDMEVYQSKSHCSALSFCFATTQV